MMDDRDFYGLLDRVLASGLRAIQRWRDRNEEPCIASDVEFFLRLHDGRRYRDSTPEDDEYYFRQMANLACKTAGHADGPMAQAGDSRDRPRSSRAGTRGVSRAGDAAAFRLLAAGAVQGANTNQVHGGILT